MIYASPIDFSTSPLEIQLPYILEPRDDSASENSVCQSRKVIYFGIGSIIESNQR